MSEVQDPDLWPMERDRIHTNARLQREQWCECCGRSVPNEDFSTKFAQAGGFLAGPFCSSGCYWRFITDHWNETTREERRQFYLYGDSDE